MKPKMLFLSAVALVIAHGVQGSQADSVQLVKVINDLGEGQRLFLKNEKLVLQPGNNDLTDRN